MQTYIIKCFSLSFWLILPPPPPPKCLFHPTLPFIFRKEFFFRMFGLQWIQYSNILICFYGWEIGHPLSTYATGGIEGSGRGEGHPKGIQVRTGGGGQKIGHKIWTNWVDGPKQMLWNIFCALVRPSTLEHHSQQRKSRCFLPS